MTGTQPVAVSGGVETWVCHSLEVARWVGAAVGFLYAVSNSDSNTELLHRFAPFLLLSFAGLSGIEDLAFYGCAPTLSGRQPNSFQRHYGFLNLALAGTGVVSCVQNWGPAADVALVAVLLVSTTLSAASHFWRSVEEGPFRVRSLVRATGTVGLLIVVLPMMISAARSL